MKAAKVNAGLAESNDRLLPGLWRELLHVTCGLTACTPGSAPGPTLGNEYGKTLLFYLSGTNRVSRYQKGTTNLDFTEETVSGSGISWAACKSAPRSRQITTPVPPPLSFLQAGCPSCHPTNSVKALKANDQLCQSAEEKVTRLLQTKS